jgi:DnaJ-domain-containing protein 1
LCARLHTILSVHPQGLSEFDLLNLLREELPDFQTDRVDPVCLFRQHFILFHALYLLQQELLEQESALLTISPLRIVLQPYQAGSADQLCVADELRRYYLDLTQLHATGVAEVEALLNAFWRQLARTDQRAQALAALGLSDPVDDASIRRRYRELVMRHHPDRGGETAQLQILNAALAMLLPVRH